MDLRCDNGILFGVVEDGFLEVTCKSTRCGKEPGVVVLHKIDLASGEVVSTRKFRDINTREEDRGGTRRQGASLRSA